MKDQETLARLLAERHSCRAFLPDPVPRATIEKILALAQRSASWCNAQPWQLIVTDGQATARFRGALQAADRMSSDLPFPTDYRGVHGERRREGGLQLYDAVGIARGDRIASARQVARNFALFDAPHVAIVTSERALGTYGALDCGGYIATFLLTAQAHGVASVAQAALAARSDDVRAHFAIPESRIVVCGISFGYEDRAHPANGFRTRRAPLDEIATFVSD